MLVPAEGVWVFGGGGSAVEALVGCDVGLGGAVAGGFVRAMNSGESVGLDKSMGGGGKGQICAIALLEVVIQRGLKPLHQHGPNSSHQFGGEGIEMCDHSGMLAYPVM